jgi:hypothetical protein
MECVAPLVAAVWFLIMLSMVTKPLIKVAPVMVNIYTALFNIHKKIFMHIYIYIYIKGTFGKLKLSHSLSWDCLYHDVGGSKLL